VEVLVLPRFRPTPIVLTGGPLLLLLQHRCYYLFLGLEDGKVAELLAVVSEGRLRSGYLLQATIFIRVVPALRHLFSSPLPLQLIGGEVFGV